MKKLFFFFLVISQITFAQNNQLWKGYFSYNQVNDLTESNIRITASTQKALFSKNLNTNELKTITTIDGLSGQDISTIHYSAAFNKTIIGHLNGLVLIVNETDGTILIVPGIRDQAGVTSNRKKINHILEHEGKLYFSCDFGVVQYDLATQGFGDTYLIGNSGEEVRAYQSTVQNNSLFVATDVAGIRRGDLANANLNDFNQWQTFDSGFWIGIVNHNNQLAGLNSNGIVYRYTGSSFAMLQSLPSMGLDIRSYDGNLVVTCANHVYAYDENFVQTAHIISNQITDLVVTFTCATVISNTVYIGTNEAGIVSVSITNTSAFQIVKPDGPSRNNIFAIQATPTNKLWAVYGQYDIFYTPDYSNFGISKLSETGWLNIPHEETLESQSLSRIILNPSDENNVFIGSAHTGILELQDDVVIAKYDHTTPNGPESVFLPSAPAFKSVRVNGAAFDRSGNLWFTNSLIDNAMKVLKADGSWQSYSIEEFVITTDQNYGRLAIDKNGTKWFVSSASGMVGFNENVTPNFKLANSEDDAGNFLAANARAVAIDNRNQLWIGTIDGLRILPNVDRFLGDEPLETNPIIIIDDDLPQELLADQFITDIVVDGSNNKWIGTADAGVFLLSPNGQETLYRFTIENSPLPSNIINDIEINGQTGEVYFATNAGLVSFLGVATDANDNLSNVFVYPNPVRPEFVGTVKISGLIDRANVKITDIEGNLVYETTSEGGTIEWDTTAFGKYRVASGVYMIFIASRDGTETKVKKVMIIR